MDELNPNALIVAAVATFLGWAWRRLRGEKTENVRDLLREIALGAVYELAQGDHAIGYVRAELERKLVAGVKRLRLPEKLARPVIVELVEWGTTAFRAEVAKRAIERDMGELVRRLRGVAGSFVPTGAMGPGPLDGADVELVAPTGNEPTHKPFGGG